MLAGAALASAPLAAQGDPTPQSARWEVDYGEYRCTLSHAFADGAITLGIRMVPGLDSANLIVVNRGWTASMSLPRRMDVVLRPSGARINADVLSGAASSGQHRFVRLSGIDRGFFDQFAESTGLVLEAEGQELLSLDIAHAAPAVQALRTCHNDLLQGWGVDPAQFARLRQHPEPLGDTARRVEGDEPMESPPADWGGFLIARYTIGVTGRVGDCTIVRSTGNANADGVVCGWIRREARFRPAIGEDGEPVAVQMILTMNILRRPNLR